MNRKLIQSFLANYRRLLIIWSKAARLNKRRGTFDRAVATPRGFEPLISTVTGCHVVFPIPRTKWGPVCRRGPKKTSWSSVKSPRKIGLKLHPPKTERATSYQSPSNRPEVPQTFCRFTAAEVLLISTEGAS